MKQKKQTQHEFALFCQSLQQYTATTSRAALITIQDATLIHRIGIVLRMQPGDTCVLFDTYHHASFTLESISKKQITGILSTLISNNVSAVHITYCVPLLKRDALDTALYALTELAINTVQLVYTTKTSRAWNSREYERLVRIMQAAAEQSKQFVLPTLKDPIEFDTLVSQHLNRDAFTLFCDPTGMPLASCINTALIRKPTNIILMSGPEGDLTEQEKQQLRSAHVTFCALTPTILRAHQAISLSAGIFRSLLY